MRSASRGSTTKRRAGAVDFGGEFWQPPYTVAPREQLAYVYGVGSCFQLGDAMGVVHVYRETLPNLYQLHLTRFYP